MRRGIGDSKTTMQINLSDHFSYGRLVKFTLPTIVMMIFTSLYGVVDGLFVSNVVGSGAFASLNLIYPVSMVINSFGFMIGTGGSALVSMNLGAKQEEKAREIFSLLECTIAVVGVTLAILGMIFLEPIARLLGADDVLMHDCLVYGRLLLAAVPAQMLQISFQSFLVVAERPKMGLYVSLLSGATNMVLDFLFMYVFGWGIAGAALATGASQVVGAVIPLWFFIRAKDKQTLHFVRPKFNGRALVVACTNGSSEMVTNISMSLVNMLYNLELMKIVGADGVIAFGIIMYVSFVFVGTFLGYSIGVAPVVGYHFGAKNEAELRSLLRKSVLLIFAASVVLTLLAEVLAGSLASIFVGYDEGLHEMTTIAIKLYSISYLLSGLNIFASAFFTALNNGAVSALISLLRTFVFLVAAILIAPIFLGLNGIWLAVVYAEAMALSVTVICFVANRQKYGYY